MQKLARAGIVLPFANDPLFNPLEVRKMYLDAANIPHIDKLLVKEVPPNPMAQMEMAEAQAKLGLTRAQELQAQSMAILNMASAKAKASEQEMAFYDNQLEAMRLRIEAINSTIKAAAVDAQVHGHNMKAKAAVKKVTKE